MIVDHAQTSKTHNTRRVPLRRRFSPTVLAHLLWSPHRLHSSVNPRHLLNLATPPLSPPFSVHLPVLRSQPSQNDAAATFYPVLSRSIHIAHPPLVIAQRPSPFLQIRKPPIPPSKLRTFPLSLDVVLVFTNPAFSAKMPLPPFNYKLFRLMN